MRWDVELGRGVVDIRKAATPEHAAEVTALVTAVGGTTTQNAVYSESEMSNNGVVLLSRLTRTYPGSFISVTPSVDSQSLVVTSTEDVRAGTTAFTRDTGIPVSVQHRPGLREAVT